MATIVAAGDGIIPRPGPKEGLGKMIIFVKTLAMIIARA